MIQDYLEGFTIPENPSPKHYIELKKRLEYLGGVEYNPKVGTSIKELKRLSRDEWARSIPSQEDYTKKFLNETNETVAKLMAVTMYKEEVKRKVQDFSEYKRHMIDIYFLTMGQIDRKIKRRFAVDSEWEEISTSSCVIGLLKLIRKICYQYGQISVHPVTNLVRAMEMLICTEPGDLDRYEYANIIKYNLEWLKSLGGSIIMQPLVEYELDNNTQCGSFSYDQYLKMTKDEKEPINRAVEKRFIKTIVTERFGEERNTW